MVPQGPGAEPVSAKKMAVWYSSNGNVVGVVSAEWWWVVGTALSGLVDVESRGRIVGQ